jgi:hypothetical protein
MVEMEQAWAFADLRQQISTLSTFVAACSDDSERAREATQLAQQAFASAPAELEAVQRIAWTLAAWAEDLEDHPHHPGELRPDAADRQVRDHVKDILRNDLPYDVRDWMSVTKLFLDVDFRTLSRSPALDPRTREDVFYIYGRGTMALDFGHREAAERELERLRNLRRTYVEKER